MADGYNVNDISRVSYRLTDLHWQDSITHLSGEKLFHDIVPDFASMGLCCQDHANWVGLYDTYQKPIETM